MRRVRGGAAKEVAPDESCEADASGLASFMLFEGDGGISSAISPNVSALSLDAPNVTSFFGLGVRLSSSVVAASPIGEGASMRSWTGGGSVPSTARKGGLSVWGCHFLSHPE